MPSADAGTGVSPGSFLHRTKQMLLSAANRTALQQPAAAASQHKYKARASSIPSQILVNAGGGDDSDDDRYNIGDEVFEEIHPRRRRRYARRPRQQRRQTYAAEQLFFSNEQKTSNLSTSWVFLAGEHKDDCLMRKLSTTMNLPPEIFEREPSCMSDTSGSRAASSLADYGGGSLLSWPDAKADIMRMSSVTSSTITSTSNDDADNTSLASEFILLPHGDNKRESASPLPLMDRPLPAPPPQSTGRSGLQLLNLFNKRQSPPTLMRHSGNGSSSSHLSKANASSGSTTALHHLQQQQQRTRDRSVDAKFYSYREASRTPVGTPVIKHKTIPPRSGSLSRQLLDTHQMQYTSASSAYVSADSAGSRSPSSGGSPSTARQQPPAGNNYESPRRSPDQQALRVQNFSGLLKSRQSPPAAGLARRNASLTNLLLSSTQSGTRTPNALDKNRALFASKPSPTTQPAAAGSGARARINAKNSYAGCSAQMSRPWDLGSRSNMTSAFSSSNLVLAACGNSRFH